MSIVGKQIAVRLYQAPGIRTPYFARNVAAGTAPVFAVLHQTLRIITLKEVE
jgi:hypothetical protein